MSTDESSTSAVQAVPTPLRGTGQPAPRSPPGLPIGYRQGVISAITVILGFDLLFLRFWGFELETDWDASTYGSVIVIAVSILGQLVSLWRSLQLEDDDPVEYRKTLRWFLGSTIVLFIGVGLAALSYHHQE
jgi:hypothetical protein